MGSKAYIIIKNVLITAILSLMGNNKVTAKELEDLINDNNSDIPNAKKRNIRGLKNPLIKLTQMGKAQMIFAHMSHSSHSSHASHSSHFSSIGTSNNGNSSSLNYSSRDAYSVGIGDGTGEKNQYAPPISPKEAGRLRLGDRILKLGLYGNDVNELTDYLISQNLLSSNQLETYGKFIKYSLEVEKVIKNLQKSLHLKETGEVDKNLAEVIIKEIEKNKTK